MDSMEQVYAKHARMIYGFLLAKTKNPDLAEELTQETFCQAVKSIHTFQRKSSMSTWLCGIAKNVWFEYLRKNKMEDPLSEANESKVESAEAVFFRSWSSLNMLKALHHLREPMREVMYLRLNGELSYRQIGEIMGKSENWARVTFYRGKEIILKEVQL
jgi:RNA polymerase sigma factor (sigma-70 family)